MKKLRYVVFFLIGLVAMSCTEQIVTPRGGEDDPVIIPPPPPKK
jgi:hypothetical protein